MQGERDAWGKAARISGFGLTAGVTMLACFGLGIWIDRHLGTTPLFAIGLFLAGGATSVWYGIVNLLQ